MANYPSISLQPGIVSLTQSWIAILLLFFDALDRSAATGRRSSALFDKICSSFYFHTLLHFHGVLFALLCNPFVTGPSAITNKLQSNYLACLNVFIRVPTLFLQTLCIQTKSIDFLLIARYEKRLPKKIKLNFYLSKMSIKAVTILLIPSS